MARLLLALVVAAAVVSFAPAAEASSDCGRGWLGDEIQVTELVCVRANYQGCPAYVRVADAATCVG